MTWRTLFPFKNEKTKTWDVTETNQYLIKQVI